MASVSTLAGAPKNRRAARLAIVEEHIRLENAHDLEGVLRTFGNTARYDDEVSSLRVSRVMLTFPGLLLRGLLRRFYWRYLIEDFGVVSICVLLGFPLWLFGVTFGTYHWVQSARTGAPATAGTVFVAALPIMLGFQLLLAAVLLDVLSSHTGKYRRPQADDSEAARHRTSRVAQSAQRRPEWSDVDT